MKGKPILRAPYMKGELGVPMNIHVLFGTVMAILFVVMPLAFIGTVKLTGQPDSTASFVVVWVLAFAAILLLEWYAKTRPVYNGFHIAVFLITLIGLPGIFMLRPRFMELVLTVGFWAILVLRNASVFMILPQVALKMRKPATEQIQTWLFVGGMIIVVMTNALYASRGYTVLNAQRGAFPDWLHPNSSAIYGGVLMLTAALAGHFKMWLRVLGGFMGLYGVLLVQSRGALVATAVAIVVLLFLSFLNDPKKYSAWFIAALLFGSLTAVAFGPSIMNVGAVKNMVERSTNNDPTAGRTEIIANVFESVKESPLVGYGFRAGRVDNIFATFALQFGLVGSAFYAIFLLAVFIRSIIVYRFAYHPAGREAARLVLVYGAYIFTRSFVESAHIMQLTDVFANAFCMLAGIIFLAPLRTTVASPLRARLAPPVAPQPSSQA